MEDWRRNPPKSWPIFGTSLWRNFLTNPSKHAGRIFRNQMQLGKLDASYITTNLRSSVVRRLSPYPIGFLPICLFFLNSLPDANPFRHLNGVSDLFYCCQLTGHLNLWNYVPNAYCCVFVPIVPIHDSNSIIPRVQQKRTWNHFLLFTLKQAITRNSKRLTQNLCTNCRPIVAPTKVRSRELSSISFWNTNERGNLIILTTQICSIQH
jgi:hypothetical protein